MVLPVLLLVVTSVLWAFSFGLIKGRLVGLDPTVVAFLRLAISALVFLPLLRPRGLGAREALRLVGLGAVQYGLMYTLYITSYRFLAAHEVALFTVFTPLYVIGLGALLERRPPWSAAGGAVLAVVAAAVTSYSVLEGGDWALGFFLLQGANLCFAAGQMLYRRWAPLDAKEQRGRFALLCFGGALLPGSVALFTAAPGAFVLTGDQALTLLYLGAAASGLGFFLWNLGATRTSAGALAVMNNAKVPLAVLVSLLVFGEQAPPGRLALALVAFGGAAWLTWPRGGAPGRQPGPVR